jgi:hypothetical protein
MRTPSSVRERRFRVEFAASRPHDGSMKVFRLACEHGHDFEGWFASPEAFDRQSASGDLACPLCDSRTVVRRPSAPYVNTGASQNREVSATTPAVQAPGLGTAVAALKAFIASHTEDVGRRFPEVARRMHYGEEDARGIRGRVTPQEAEELRDEGVEAVALPPGLIPNDEAH